MHIKTYKTYPITIEESLFRIIDAYIPKLDEQSIFVITSKIISLCEGSIVRKTTVASKEPLIQEVDSALAIDSLEEKQLLLSLMHPEEESAEQILTMLGKFLSSFEVC